MAEARPVREPVSPGTISVPRFTSDPTHGVSIEEADMTEPKRKMGLRTAIGVSVITGMALFGALMMVSSGRAIKPSAAESVPIVTFEDGAVLEVLGTSIGKRIVEYASPDEVPGREPAKTSFGSQVGGSCNGGIDILTEQEDGHVVRCTTRSLSAKTMLMEIRLCEVKDNPLKMPAYLLRFDLVDDDTRLAGAAKARFFKLPEDSEDGWRAAMGEAKLQLVIQHRDPQAGWIHLTGPFLYNESTKDRYIMALPAWQRNLPTMEFRAIRANGMIREFSLPNPDFIPRARRGNYAPAPQVHKASDYSFTVERVAREPIPGKLPFVYFETKLEFDGETVDDPKNSPVVADGLQVEDDLGNLIPMAYEKIRNRSMRGAFLPATAKGVRANFYVARVPCYPRNESDGIAIMEGVVAADGKTAEFKLLPGAEGFGMSKLPVGKIAPVGKWQDEGATRGWKTLGFQLHGENDLKSYEPIIRKLGEMGQWQYQIFPEGSMKSAGKPDSIGNCHGSYGNTEHGMNFTIDVSWLGPPETLRPGARFRFALHPPLQNDELKFEIALP